MPIATDAYAGRVVVTGGVSDPEARAINGAYQGGAGDAIGNCDFTDFGVGFYREEYADLDAVSIVFGARNAVATPPGESRGSSSDATLVPTPAVQKCPPGSPTPTVPAFGTCAAARPPKDAISVSFVKGPLWTVNVKNAASIAGTCTYTAAGPGGGLGNRSFDVAANGSASFQVPAPLPLVSYHVVTSCHGTFDGTDVEFGHDEKDVSA
jgi:hypothetical protein